MSQKFLIIYTLFHLHFLFLRFCASNEPRNKKMSKGTLNGCENLPVIRDIHTLSGGFQYNILPKGSGKEKKMYEKRERTREYVCIFTYRGSLYSFIKPDALSTMRSRFFHFSGERRWCEFLWTSQNQRHHFHFIINYYAILMEPAAYEGEYKQLSDMFSCYFSPIVSSFFACFYRLGTLCSA